MLTSMSVEEEEGEQTALGRSSSMFKGPGAWENLMSYGTERTE